MNRCPVCGRPLVPANPDTDSVVLADDDGEVIWVPLCPRCADELAWSEAAVEP
jgi:endogenous inhibitor of DNA gyrase (YacG/DUF329 family)